MNHFLELEETSIAQDFIFKCIAKVKKTTESKLAWVNVVKFYNQNGLNIESKNEGDIFRAFILLFDNSAIENNGKGISFKKEELQQIVSNFELI